MNISYDWYRIFCCVAPVTPLAAARGRRAPAGNTRLGIVLYQTPGPALKPRTAFASENWGAVYGLPSFLGFTGSYACEAVSACTAVPFASISQKTGEPLGLIGFRSHRRSAASARAEKVCYTARYGRVLPAGAARLPGWK